MNKLLYEIRKLNKLVQLKFAVIEVKLTELESIDNVANSSDATLLTSKVTNLNNEYLYTLLPLFINPSEIV